LQAFRIRSRVKQEFRAKSQFNLKRLCSREHGGVDKAPDAFRTISEVAAELEVPQHVLRFWESRFHEIRPMKRGGGRRFYRPQDVDLLRGIRHLLYGEGYTIRGVQRILREQGQRFVQNVWQPGAPQPARMPAESASGEGADELDAEGRARAPRFSAPGGERHGQQGEQTGNALEEGRIAPRVTSSSVPGLPHQHVRKLQAVLDDLAECRRLLETALSDRP
jgi:DNA-binding transcriptional MerR regulator